MNIKHCSQSEKDTFKTVYIQNMIAFSTVISYFNIISLMRIFFNYLFDYDSSENKQ